MGFSGMKTAMSILFVASLVFSCAGADGAPSEEGDSRPLIQVFYKDKDPSLETLDAVEKFLEPWESAYEIRYLVITDSTNAGLMTKLGLPTEHFPFAVAVDGKTSAEIGGKTVVFAHFPDFMQHVGKHPGNWTLDHLNAVLEDNGLLLPENPVVTSSPGGDGGEKKEE